MSTYRAVIHAGISNHHQVITDVNLSEAIDTILTAHYNSNVSKPIRKIILTNRRKKVAGFAQPLEDFGVEDDDGLKIVFKKDGSIQTTKTKG